MNLLFTANKACAKASASAGGHARWNIMGLKAPMYVKASDSTASSEKNIMPFS